MSNFIDSNRISRNNRLNNDNMLQVQNTGLTKFKFKIQKRKMRKDIKFIKFVNFAKKSQVNLRVILDVYYIRNIVL